MKINSNRKPKIPNTLKFPIGFEIINESLKNNNSEKSLEIIFSSEFENIIDHFAPYSFGNPIKLKGQVKELSDFRLIVNSSYSLKDDKWIITIFPCKKEDSMRNKEFLIKKGLQICDEWIGTNKTETWYQGQRFIQIGLNDYLSKYCVVETQNEYIVKMQVKDL